MVYLLIPLMLAVSALLAWSWWSGRIGRDPVSSIDSFHRALDAMQPSFNHEPPLGHEPSPTENDDGSTTPVA